jgi:hypothetical protein
MGKAARLKKERAARRRAEQALIQTYARVASGILPSYFDTSCCLNGTRVALEVFAHFNVPAEPVVTQAEAFNAPMFANLLQHPGADTATVDAWIAEQGAWGIGVGHKGTPGPGYNGHLIAFAAGCIVDSSAGQFHREQRNIITKPVEAHPASRGFRNGRLSLYRCESSGTVLCYTAQLGRTDYQSVPGFWRSTHNLAVAAKVIEAMEGA